MLNFAKLEQRPQYNWDVLKNGTSGNLPQFNFRLPKTAEHVVLQAQSLRLLVVTRKKGPFPESSGVIDGHKHESTLEDYWYTHFGDYFQVDS